MEAWQALGKLLRRKATLAAATFEELFERFRTASAQDRVELEEEFVKRTSDIVYRMALEASPDADEASRLVDEAYAGFASKFDAGELAYGLQRFAHVLRDVLNDQAFNGHAETYYRQLFVYHLEDEQQRRCLAFWYRKGLQDGALDELAQMERIPVEQVEKVIAAARRNLTQLIQREFEPDEVKQLTEGYVKWNSDNHKRG